MNIVNASQLVSLGLFICMCGLPACGSTPPADTTSKSTLRSVDGLLKSVENLEGSGRLSNALLQFAFLYPEDAPRDRASKRRAMLLVKDWKRLGEKLVFVSTTVEEGLPIDLGSLAQTAPDENARQLVTRSKQVLLVRYLGPTLPNSEHLPIFLRLATAAAGDFSYTIDLSTRRIMARDKFAAWNEDSSMMFAEQVVPGIERAENQTITFYSRGMAKFGLPDLEQTNVARETARKGFVSFQGVLSKALETKTLQVGDRFEGFTLAPCKRATIAIEKDCVNLAVSAQ